MSYKSAFDGPEEYFPPAGFFFDVKIDGSGHTVDTQFQEVSGIEVTHETETISEGGLNEYSHVVPKKVKYSNLVLKRGLAVKDSALVAWWRERFNLDEPGKSIFGGGKMVKPKNVQVTLMDSAGTAIMMWTFNRAWPVKWNVSGFNSTENKIVIETIELAYRDFKVNVL